MISRTWSLCLKLAVRTRKNFSNSPVVNDQLMGNSHSHRHLAPQCSLTQVEVAHGCTSTIWSFFFFFFLSFFFLSANDIDNIDNTNVKHSRSGSLSPELLFPWRAAAWPRRRAGVLFCLLSTQPKTNKPTRMQQSAVYPKRSRKMLPEQRGRCHGCPRPEDMAKHRFRACPVALSKSIHRSQIDMTAMRESSTKAQRNTRILSKRGTTEMGPKYVPI